MTGEIVGRSLFEYGQGMDRRDVEEIFGISEHGVSQLRREGRLSPIKIGGRLIFPRWQIAQILGLIDPDVAASNAAADAASEAMNVGTTPVVVSAVPMHDSMRPPEEVTP